MSITVYQRREMCLRYPARISVTNELNNTFQIQLTNLLQIMKNVILDVPEKHSLFLFKYIGLYI